jgi:hypothetical protein
MFCIALQIDGICVTIGELRTAFYTCDWNVAWQKKVTDPSSTVHLLHKYDSHIRNRS